MDLHVFQVEKQCHSNINNLSTFEYEDYIRSTTKTLIASCPNGGPIATVTVPSTTTTSLGKNGHLSIYQNDD